MASILKGTTCLFGVNGTVSNLFVQSYSLSSNFNEEATVADENGLTKTWRADDRKSELTVEGIVKVGTMPSLGDAISFALNANTAYPSGSASSSFAGWITKIDEKGGNKEFVKVSITAVDFEGVSNA